MLTLGYCTALTTILAQHNDGQPLHDLMQQKYHITNFLPRDKWQLNSSFDQLRSLNTSRLASTTGLVHTESPQTGAQQCMLIKKKTTQR
jgi:hypothetical protein